MPFFLYLQYISKILPSSYFITMVTRFNISDRNLYVGSEEKLIVVNIEDRNWAQFENSNSIC